MKRMKKGICFATSMLMLCAMSNSVFAFHNSTTTIQTEQQIIQPLAKQQSISNSQDIEQRYHIIEWQYKIIDGKIYKRQFNLTTGKWIGDWVLA